jgi:hypothetical protein
MTCHRLLQVPKGTRPQERSSGVCNGRPNGLRRSHSVAEVKAREGWVKVLPILARGRLGNTSEPTRQGQGHGGSAEPVRRYRTVLNTSQVTPTPWELAFAAVTSRW